MRCLSKAALIALVALSGPVGCKQATITAPVGEPLPRESLEPLVGAWDSEEPGEATSIVQLGQNGNLYVAIVEFDDKTGTFETATVELSLRRLEGQDFAFFRVMNLTDKGPGPFGFAHVVKLGSDEFVWRHPDFDAFAAAVRNNDKLGRFLIGDKVVKGSDDSRHVEIKGDADLFWEILESQGIDACFPVENEGTLYRRKETRPAANGQER